MVPPHSLKADHQKHHIIISKGVNVTVKLSEGHIQILHFLRKGFLLERTGNMFYFYFYFYFILLFN